MGFYGFGYGGSFHEFGCCCVDDGPKCEEGHRGRF